MPTYRRFTNGQPAWWEADNDLNLDQYGPPVDGGHENCRHRHYRLTCGQYERLLRRSQNRCEMCGLPGPENAMGKLHIDHDQDWGQWAVRGLLCHDCNARERFPWMAMKRAAYVANAWYVHRLAKLGVPLAVPEEPPVGATVADHRGLHWVRQDDDAWLLQWGAYKYTSKSWWQMVRAFGPHNLHLISLPRDEPKPRRRRAVTA